MKLNGDMLRDARDQKGIPTQDALAVATGISRPTIVRAEAGEEIQARIGIRLCEFLGLNLGKAVITRVQNGDGDAA